MLLGPVLIRLNGTVAMRLFPTGSAHTAEELAEQTGDVGRHVILCGYGRVGQSLAHVLEGSGIACVGLDFDPNQVREARRAGNRVYYGDSGRREILLAAGIERARLVVVTFDDPPTALKILDHTRTLRPEMPVLVRARDEAHFEFLEQAGATEVVPETLEASLMLAAHAMLLLGEPASRVQHRIDQIRQERYRLLRDLAQADMPSGGLDR